MAPESMTLLAMAPAASMALLASASAKHLRYIKVTRAVNDAYTTQKKNN